MRITTSLCFLFVASLVHAAPQPGRVLEVIDGDTLKVVSVDSSGKTSGKPAIFGIRGMAVPALDQPFGKQSLDRLKELVDGKKVIWNGPFPRAHKKGRALHFRTENGKSLAFQLISEGLAWVVESELEKPKSSDPVKLAPEAVAEREARAAKRGLWADKDPMPPWKWRGKANPVTDSIGMTIRNILPATAKADPFHDRVPPIENSVGMTLRFIPPGTFLMGSADNEAGRESQETRHEV